MSIEVKIDKTDFGTFHLRILHNGLEQNTNEYSLHTLDKIANAIKDQIEIEMSNPRSR